MNFNQHSKYEGRHAFLSASKYSWLNYDVPHLKETFKRSVAAAKGTKLHALAAELIKMGIKLPRSNKTLNRYVNDAIGYRMQPEVVLFYSDNCFGTADAINFKDNLLRIHDLKTGESPVKMDQLEIYAAIFCLEYDVNPNDINIELRIYQNDDYETLIPEADDIQYIMDKIIEFDNVLNDLISEEVNI